MRAFALARPELEAEVQERNALIELAKVHVAVAQAVKEIGILGSRQRSSSR